MNIKSIFFVSLLILLLVGITGVSAADDTNNATISESHQTADSLQVQEHANDNSIKTLTKKTKQNVKENTTNSVDYYVSDTTGSDTNNGTEDSPFKTLQTAIDKTKYGKTNNIYIKNGIYHGQGNTNLTIDGEKTINFIGENKEDTIFYGNASYDINTTEYYWGSSSDWYYYENETGNWFMNITKGIGKITISNLTVSRMYAIGAGPGTYHSGDSIKLYPIANVDNYGKLEVNNVLFNQNYGGVGSAIRNNNKATLTVTNSEFTKNQKSSSSGNMGILYNKGTATVLNSNFHDNYARWGTILNDNKLTVINTTLSNNIGYNGGSTYKYGAGIASNSGSADFNNIYGPSENIETTIINSTFQNCDQASIWAEETELTIKGNKFTNTTGIRVDKHMLSTYETNKTITIEDNTFDNIKGSMIDRSLSVHEPKYFTIDLNIYTDNLNITNNLFTNSNGTIISTYSGNIINNTIKSRGNTTAIELLPRYNGTKTITGNTLYSPMVINTNNTIVSDNKIITTEEYAIIANNTDISNNTITDNYLLSQYAGNNAVNTNTKNTVKNNTPTEDNENIYVNPDETEEKEGTLANPTTLKNALTKINNNKTIIILPGSNNQYNINETISISSSTLKEGTKTFTIESLTEVELKTNNTLFTIANGYNVTLKNIKLSEMVLSKVFIQNNGELTFNQCDISKNNITYTNGIISNTGTINFIDTTIASNRATARQHFLTNTGTANFINNTISSNFISEGYFINNANGQANILENNIFNAGTSNRGNLIAFSGSIKIIGNNLINNSRGMLIGNADKIIIEGNNTFSNLNDVTNTGFMIYSKELIINGTNTFGNFNFTNAGLLYGENITIMENNIFENITSTQTSYLLKFVPTNSEFDFLITNNNTFNNISTKTFIYNQGTSAKCPIIINGTNTFNNINAETTIQSAFILMNGSNKFHNNKVYRILYSLTQKDSQIIGTEFYNNTLLKNDAIKTGILNFRSGAYNIKTIVSDNIFLNNNYQDTSSSINLEIRELANGVTNITISNNIFENETFETGAAIYANEAELPQKTIEITNNTFKNIKSDNETINIPGINNKTIEGNTYTNCTIGLDDFKLESELDGQTIVQNTIIPLNISAGLLHPEYYDDNIMENLTYEIYVNDNIKQETPDKNTNITEGYIAETDGILTIYAKMNKMSNQTNNITVTIIKPLDTEISITVPDENTVNKTTPMTIMLFDEEGNLIRNTTINMTINNKTEEVALVNGAIVYQFTPETVGNTTIKFSFAGNDTLNPTETEATINVVADKDAIIEELNNTVQEQNETINDLNNTVNSQDKTIQELEQNMTDANNKIDSLNNNITNLNNQVKDLTNENKQLKNNLTTANNKINAQDKQIQDLNKSLIDANKAIQDANKQIKDLNSTVAKLNEQIKNMTTPIDTKVTINTITAVKYSSDVKITGTLTDKAGNTIKNTAVTLNINGKTNNVATDNKGTYTYTGKATTVGTNNVTVQYTATDKYNAAKATSTFKVNKQDLKITINNITSDAYKEDVTVTGVFTDATGKGLSNTNLNITINSKTVKVRTTTGGVFTYTTKANKVGTNNLTVSYAGNANYNKATTKTTFKVVKQDLIVTIDNLDDVRFKENITISGKFVDGNAKPIGNTILTINLNGKKYTVKTNAQGVYKRSIRVTQIDTNNVTVTYNGNANYNKCTAKATFKALKQNLGITLDSVKTANGKITVTGTFTDEESKPLMNSNVKVTINNKTYTAKTDNKGIYTLTKAYTATNITLTLSYPGNKNYNSFTKTTKLTV